MNSSKTNYKALSEVLLGNLTVDGLKKTIRQRHPNMTVQGNKDELQKRLADAEGLTLSSSTNAATAVAKPKSTGNKFPPEVTGIPEIEAKMGDLFRDYHASRMGKTKKVVATASTGDKKSSKCTECNKRYTSKTHDVTDFTEGLCRNCALNEGYIIDCEYCKKKNVPEIFGNYCDRTQRNHLHHP
eukprot:CAMPEP_0181034574 /NCGR_PEP_ID=MMETSP1070-20121207/7883_1 /TAXON_ID=265543 /ORGANISM="Minutocellus polymorphus, Strain NH13" /LENGTH=184 /DNA_ID=CAMNT_0023112117 /DNA_START=429 /DNA_END=979 /DNA_ORIENTATION=+